MKEFLQNSTLAIQRRKKDKKLYISETKILRNLITLDVGDMSKQNWEKTSSFFDVEEMMLFAKENDCPRMLIEDNLCAPSTVYYVLTLISDEEKKKEVQDKWKSLDSKFLDFKYICLYDKDPRDMDELWWKNVESE